MNYQDEIIDGEAVYDITSSNGTISNATIKLKNTVLQQGTALNKVFFDELFSKVIPTGLITLWSGATVPSGWHLCDGTSGTPDLRNRFIVGAGGEYSIGATGGEKTHTLTTNELPAHNHNIYTYNSSRATSQTVLSVGGSSSSTDMVKPVTTNYTTSTNNYVQNAGGGQAHENRPPYYALAYIMKL